MKKKILGVMVGVCLMASAMIGCGAESAVVLDNRAETDDGGIAAQPDGFQREEQAEEREPYLAKKIEHDRYGMVTEYEYDEQGSLIKMTESYGFSREDSTTASRKEYEFDSAGKVIRFRSSYTSSSKYENGREEVYSQTTEESEYGYDASGNLIKKSTSSESVYDGFREGPSEEDGSYEKHNRERGTTEEEYEYDASGNMLRYKSTMDRKIESDYTDGGEYADDSQDWSITQETVYEYDGAGNTLRETESYARHIFYKGDGHEETHEYTERTEYEYDGSGNLTERIHYSDDSEVSRTEYEYDEAGNLTMEAMHQNGEEYYRNEYEYDGTGNLIKETLYHDDMESSRAENEYDGAGNLSKVSVYLRSDDEADILMLSTESEYDTAGHEVKVVSYYYRTKDIADHGVEIGDIRFWSESVYDEAGKKISQTEYDENGDVSRTEFVYNETGDLTDTIHYDEDGNITYRTESAVEEEYDDAGLLVKVTIYKDGQVVSWTEYEYK